MVDYLKNYVLPQNGFKVKGVSSPNDVLKAGTSKCDEEWEVIGYKTQDEVFDIVTTQQTQPIALAISIFEFDTSTDTYEIKYSLGKD